MKTRQVDDSTHVERMDLGGADKLLGCREKHQRRDGPPRRHLLTLERDKIKQVSPQSLRFLCEGLEEREARCWQVPSGCNHRYKLNW